MAGSPYLLAASAQSKPTNSPEYRSLTGRMNGNTIEANRQQKWPIAGTIDKFRVYVDNAGITRTYRSRINAAFGSINPTITDITAGVYYDDINLDPIVLDDLLDFQTSIAITNTATWYWHAMRFVPASGQVAIWGATPGGFPVASATRYIPIDGIPFNATTPGPAQAEIRIPGVISNLRIQVGSNSQNGDTVFTLNVNGTNTALTATVLSTSGGPVWVEDNTHSITVALGDLVCVEVANAASTGACAINITQLLFTPTAGSSVDHFIFGSQIRAASATVHYLPPVGGILNMSSTSETERRVVLPFPCTLRNFRFKCSANTYSADATLTLRKNGADVITKTLTAGSTLLAEDIVTRVSFNGATDDFSISIVGGTSGSITSSYFAYTLDGGPMASSANINQAVKRASFF